MRQCHLHARQQTEARLTSTSAFLSLASLTIPFHCTPPPSSVGACPMMKSEDLARVSATFIRRESFRNPTPAFEPGAPARTHERMMMSFS